MRYFYAALVLALFSCPLSAQHGLHIEQGPQNNATGGGMAVIGNTNSYRLKLDNNGIQAGFGTNASTLYQNYFGGHINMLGNSNTTGNLYVDGIGLSYINNTNRVGIGTTNPDEKLEVYDGNMKITTGSQINGGLRLEHTNKSVNANLEMESSGSTGELIYNMSVNNNNGGGIRNPAYEGAIFRIDTRTAASEVKGFQWFWIPAGGSALNYMSLRDNGHLQLKKSAGDEMVIINDDFWSHSTGSQDFGSGGDHFIMASKEGSSESAGIYGDGNALAFWSAGDANSGQPAALAYFMDEDFFDANGNPYDNGALKAYINTAGTWVVSDERKKEKILGVENALEKIGRLNGYHYDYKRSTTEVEKNSSVQSAVGILAQELKSVIPEAVQVNADGEHFVNYDMIIPVLIEAIKEQQIIIDGLRSK